MAKVFVSHSSVDATVAAELHRWLTEDGHEAFLDQDLHDGLAMGEEWQERLHGRLRWADAMVCVLTSAYVGSTWCAAEVGIAQSRGSRVLPVRAEPGVAHPLLRAVQHLDMTGNEVTVRTRLAEALRRVDAVGGSGWADDRSPFPGLRPFVTEEHRAFFGRTGEVEQLAALLRSPAERTDGAVLLVVGPSGCGKSSLVRAGLLPVMAAEPSWWTLPVVLPGTRPVAALTRELAATARRTGASWSVADVRRRLNDGGLVELADELLLAAPGPPRRHLLIVVDQFEELVTQTAAGERLRFAELLRPALAGPVQVVGTLRPEFLDQLLLSPELAALPKRVHPMEPLRREALRGVIEGPARLAGIGVDQGLVARLVADTDSGEALPLLAYTLAQLADGVERGGTLHVTRYEQLGGVRGALARQADLALGEAASTGGRGRDQVIAELLRLVTVDENGRPTRWRARSDELPGPVAAELDAFVRRRLLTTDLEDGRAVVGVAHEAFLSAWAPLADAITADVTALRARRQVEQAASEWADDGHRSTRLWERGRLAAALADTGARVQTGRPLRGTATAGRSSAPERRRPSTWTCRHRVLVTDRVELSRQARDFLLASTCRDRRRRGRSTTILSMLLVLAVGAAGVAIGQQRAAEQRQRLATARGLLAQSNAVQGSDPRTALLLAEAAHEIQPDRETQAGLVQILLGTRYAGSLEGHTGAVLDVAYAPDGRTLATAGDDQTVLLWDLTDPARPRRLGEPLTGHTGQVSGVAFTPDGRTLVTIGDQEALLWDLADPTHPHRRGELMVGHTGTVSPVAFTPDGRTLAVAEGAGDDAETLLLWDVTDPARPRRLADLLAGEIDGVNAVGSAPRGGLLAIAGWNDDEGNIALLWDVTDPARPRRVGGPLTGPTDAVNALAFSPDGHTFAMAGTDQTVLLWDLTDPADPRRLGDPLTGHTDWINAVAFSPDGRTLASAGDDDTVLLWDLTDPARPRRLGEPLIGHAGGVFGVAFAPDGRTLASVGDNSAVLWELGEPAQPRRLVDPLIDRTDGGSGIAFARDGGTLTTAGRDMENASAAVWDLTDPARPRSLGEPSIGRTDEVSEMAVAPDGRIVATTGVDHSVVLWNLADPARPRPLGDPVITDAEATFGMAFAPDGRTLATAGDGNTVLLWDVTDPARPRSLGKPLMGDPDEVYAMAFTQHGRTLAIAGNQAVLLWDLTDPARPRRLGDVVTSHPGPVSGVAFSPDGSMLATFGDQDDTALLWDVALPAQPRRRGEPLTGDAGVVTAVAFSPDGSTLAVAWNEKVVLWDLTDSVRSRRLGEPLMGHTGTVTALTFAPDGRILATSEDRTLQLWDLDGLIDLRDHPRDRACEITRHGLDPVQWAHYVPDLEYLDSCEE